MARKRRGLTAEEAELWRAVQHSVRPFHAVAVAAPEASEPAITAAAAPKAAASVLTLPRTAPPEPGRVTLDLAPDPSELAQLPPRMDRRRFERLRRGKLEPEARLDLHGMTRARAQDALTGFLLDAHASGLRLVLVITGKGRLGESAFERPGILRHSLPQWLASPLLGPRVLEVRPAHQRHGGSGAFYIYLRRRREGP